jgi:hypothetical protein
MSQTADKQPGPALRRATSSLHGEIGDAAPVGERSFQADSPPPPPREWLAAAAFHHVVRALDERLRRAQGIAEYSHSRDCILRVEPRRAEGAVRLADGTEVRPDDALLELHLWNEHLPRISVLGPHLGWALRVRTQMRLSLIELADKLAHRPEYADVVALHARISWGRATRSGRMLSLARRFGFRPSSEFAPRGALQHLHDFWEDFLIFGLICTFNPRSLRGAGLLRHRAELWMSRRELIDRYGAKSHLAGSRREAERRSKLRQQAATMS